MPWELLPKVHWRYYRGQKIIFWGSRKSIGRQKRPILGHFYLNIAILGLFCSLFLVAEHVYEPFYMIYVMEIVASGTLDAFLSSENYSFGGLESQSDVKKGTFWLIFI